MTDSPTFPRRAPDLSGLAFGDPGAGALRREAHLRRDPEALAEMLARGRVLPVWRGRPLFRGPDARLGLVGPDSPVLADADAPPLFLGVTPQGPVFAADISAFRPEGPAPDLTAFPDPNALRHPALPASWGFAELRARMAGLDPLEAEIAASARALTGWHATHRFCAACGNASVPGDGGWSRRCPACLAQHFPRTDPVVIMLVTRANRLLLGRSPGWPEGMYSCLAGFMEPGETVEAAVRREVAEETGVRIGTVRYIASQPWPFPASLMLGCRAEALSETITPDPLELEDALWLPREQMAQVLAGTHPSVRAPRPGAIAGWMVREWLADRLD